MSNSKAFIPRILRVAVTAGAIVGINAAAHAEEVCTLLSGASIVAQDSGNTFLGKVASSYDRDSIFNEYGSYGSEYSAKSIWNQYSTFGNEYNSLSPHNEYSSQPPMLIKQGKIIGYLTANKGIKSSISPGLLKAMCKDEL